MNENLPPLTILRGILRDPLIRAFFLLPHGEHDFLHLLYERGAEEDFGAYLSRAVTEDDNAFARACAAGTQPSVYVWEAIEADLKTIADALRRTMRRGFGAQPLSLEPKRLARLYAESGYGAYLRHVAFRFDREELLVPISSPSSVVFRDLKGYAREKAEVCDNLENFVRGLPYADMLLYGDRGTGKSSTVHAAVNLFCKDKVRLVELAKEDLLSLPRLKTYLSAIPMKFVVFIDDFSLTESDDRVSTLKAALQGSMEGCAGNVMIVATSNRRHIVEERFDTRSQSVHSGENEDELLSLSDRFGLTVLFSATDKRTYLSIVRELADDAGVQTGEETLFALAERWALLHGGRSPRRARQFIDYVRACEGKHKTPEL